MPQGHELTGRATAPIITVVRGVGADQLDLATPCSQFTVRELLDHVGRTAQALAAAAGTELDADADLATRIQRAGAAWSHPAVWAGQRAFGGNEMPAALLGGLTLIEFTVHGWDLARSTGQRPDWDTDVLEFVFTAVTATAGLGRQMGAYGPEVPVPADAPLLDRLLGLVGRDPQWKA